jgi:hypothetical protein
MKALGNRQTPGLGTASGLVALLLLSRWLGLGRGRIGHGRGLLGLLLTGLRLAGLLSTPGKDPPKTKKHADDQTDDCLFHRAPPELSCDSIRLSAAWEGVP